MADEQHRAAPDSGAPVRRRRRSSGGRARIVAAAVVVGLIAVAAAVLIASNNGEAQKDPTFVASSGDAPATVWAVGDSADGGSRPARVADLIDRGDPDRVLYLGDVYEKGTAEEFERNYEPAYGRFAEITAPTPGNHEWYTREQGYQAYWDEAKGRPAPDYYDFRVAGWQVISLNSEDEHGPQSEQVKWLDSRLRGPGDCRLVFYHRPRFSAGSHGDDPTQETLWRPLPGKAALLLNAHEHNMQRLKPWKGVSQYIVGSGGHSNYRLDEKDPRLAFANETDDGALRIELRPGEAKLRFVDVGGRVLDTSTVRCTR